jgi:hypothetical protein
MLVALAATMVTTGLAACSSNRAKGANPYFTARFDVHVNARTFGQDPSWTADGRVLSNERDSAGTEQIYVSNLAGSPMRCVTCGQPGPNGFPQERPQGDWILFCSWRGQTVTFGAPCLGGVGTDLYVMRPDGSEATRLTRPGTAFERAGVPFDNYHPSWSPDGKQIVWTHLAFEREHDGGTQWTMLVADFVATATGPPHLANIDVVGPSGNTAYETQVWAPDGSGFLYTLFTSAEKASGWLNTELYFMRVRGGGASLAHPTVEHLTDFNPGWDEQAVFTPDMKDVIWMSSRAAPTWYQTVVTAAQQTGFEPPMQNEVVGAMFVLTVLDPGFHTDLYELDLSSGAIRRLTHLDKVVPEFYFDHSGRRLLWSEGGGSRTIVGQFALPLAPASAGRRVAPAKAWIGAPRAGPVSTPEPGAGPSTGASTALPPSVTEGLVLLESQLADLAQRLHGLPRGPSCCRSAAPSTPLGVP